MDENRKIWSVSEVNRYIGGIVDEDPYLGDISVKGELSNVKYHSSGHIYFTLKDSGSVLNGVMFKSQAQRLAFRMDAGDKVVIRGRISVFERNGAYQLYAQSVRAEGEGELYRKFEELKKELLEMGLFDARYKKPIPRFVTKLGVVTSPTGAAVQDIINASKRRNPFIEITLYPAKVQGEGAADSVAKGIRELNKLDIDCIIIGRGGGSIEELWAFNEEKVARAIFESAIPVISGTGHETDTTIADLVADLRATTPSSAAELAVFQIDDFDLSLERYKDQYFRLMERKILRYREETADIKAALEARSPVSRLKVRKERLERLYNNLSSAMQKRLTDNKHRMAVYAERLKALSPLDTLTRGYTFTAKTDGSQVRRIRDVKPGDEVKIYTSDGRILADVRETEEIRY